MIRHQEPNQVSVSPLCKPLSSNPVSSPTGRMSSSVCNESIPPPISSPGSSVSAKHMKKSSGLSPVTPKINTDTYKQTGNRPKAKLMGRFTRSMAKGNVFKPPVSDSVHVETVVIDDEKGKPVLPDDDRNIGHEFISNLVDDSPPTFDKDIRVDPVVDSPAKGKTVETNVSGWGYDAPTVC